MKHRLACLLSAAISLSACDSPLDEQLRGEMQLNEQRIGTLKRGNDSLTHEREVVFWARFKAPTDLPCFDTWLASHDFTVQFKSERKDNPQYPHVVEFTKTMIPVIKTMNEVSEALIRAAATCNGRYQEWEAPVVP